MITGVPNVGFMMDVATQDGDGVEATMITSAPMQRDELAPVDETDDDELDDSETLTGQRPSRRRRPDGDARLSRASG